MSATHAGPQAEAQVGTEAPVGPGTRVAPVLIAGIGNIFLGDDAFGVEVAQRLSRRAQPDGVRVADFGIRGFDLAFALQESGVTAILVDALPRGEAPGTLTVIEPAWEEVEEASLHQAPELAIETHAMDPLKVMRLAKALGAQPARVLVVGCEPASLGEDEDGVIGLSAAVQAAIEPAVALVESLARSVQQETAGAAGGQDARRESEERTGTGTGV